MRIVSVGRALRAATLVISRALTTAAWVVVDSYRGVPWLAKRQLPHPAA